MLDPASPSLALPGRSAIALAGIASLCASTAFARDASGANEQRREAWDQPAGEVRPDIEGDRSRITVTAIPMTRSPVSTVDTARRIIGFTQDEISRQGARTLDELVGSDAGVHAQPFGLSTRGDTVYVRGFSAPRSLDGLPLLMGFAAPRIDLWTIDRVEVLGGPSGVLNGSGAPGGSIAMSSKRPDTGGDRLHAEVRAGSFQMVQGALDANFAISAGDVPAALRVLALGRASGTQVAGVEDDRRTLSAALRVDPATDSELVLRFVHERQDAEPAAQFLPAIGTLLPLPDGRRIGTRSYFGTSGFSVFDTEAAHGSVHLRHRIAPGFLLEGAARATEARSRYRSTRPAIAGGGLSRIDAAGMTNLDASLLDTQSSQLAADIRLRAGFSTGGLEHRIVTGIQHTRATAREWRAFLPGFARVDVFAPEDRPAPDAARVEAATVRRPTRHLNQWGAYLADAVHAGPIVATVGLRIEALTDTIAGKGSEGGERQIDHVPVMDLGILWHGPSGFTAWASRSESFEPVIGYDAFTGTRLVPQRGRQFEAGLRWDRSRAARISLSAWQARVANQTTPWGTPDAQNQQEGVFSSRGFDADASVLLGESLSAGGSLSHFRGKVPGGGDLGFMPDWRATARVVFEPRRGPFSGLHAFSQVRYTGPSRSYGRSLIDFSELKYTVPAYLLVDATLRYPVGPAMLGLSVRNLTDKDHLASCFVQGYCFAGQRRTVTASLSLRL